jgi:hypothetical protein
MLFARAEAIFEWGFGQRLNPLSCLGAFGWYFFWIVAGSGIYLYLFFDTGITNAYASIEYITHDQWYAAGIMRSLHRYASDALVVVVVLCAIVNAAVRASTPRPFHHADVAGGNPAGPDIRQVLSAMPNVLR